MKKNKPRPSHRPFFKGTAKPNFRNIKGTSPVSRNGDPVSRMGDPFFLEKGTKETFILLINKRTLLPKWDPVS